MPRSSQVIASFASGETTPTVHGRVDTDQYPQFLSTLENCFVEKHGGVRGRNGLHHVFGGGGIHSSKTPDRVRLIDFVYSREDSYVMEFGHHYVRFYKNQAYVSNPGYRQEYYSKFGNQQQLYYPGSYIHYHTGDGSTTVFKYRTASYQLKVWKNGVEQTATTHYTHDAVAKEITFVTAPADGDDVRIIWYVDETTVSGFVNDVLDAYATATLLVTGMEIVFAASIDAGDIVRIQTSADAVSTETKVLNTISTDPAFEIWSPFSDDEIDELYWAQANDVMVFTHHNHKPWTLTRYANDFFDWDQVVYWGLPCYQASTFQTQIVEGETDFRFDFNCPTGEELVELNGVLQTVTTDYTVAGYGTDLDGVVTFVTAPPVGSEILIYHAQDSSPDEYDNPRCVAYFHERLWFAGSLRQPQTLWGSRTADFPQFYVPNDQIGLALAPDSPVEYTIAAYTHEAIEWLSSEKVLVVGTSATEHRLAPDQYIATDRVPTVSKMTDYGGAHEPPMYMGDQTCFIQRTGRQVRTFKQSYNTVTEEYQSVDLNWMAAHMTEYYWLKEPCYALMPYNIAVMIRQDGQSMCCMYDPSAGAMDVREVGWSRFITDGDFKSVRVVPESFQHRIWYAVEREVDGETQVHIEYFDSDIHLDAALTYSGTAITTVTNLDHLEGKTVGIVADGVVQDTQVVSSGEITLDAAATEVVVGLPFTKKLVTVPYANGNTMGSAKGKPGRWNEIWAELYQSARPVINGIELKRKEKEEIHSGAVRVFNTGYDRNKQITIEQSDPLPLRLVSLYGSFTVGNG